MRKLSLLMVLISTSVLAVKAQEFSSPIKSSLFGFSINGTDFQTPAEIKATSLGTTIKNKDFSSLKRLDPGFSLMFWKGITKKIDFSVRYNGIFTEYSKDPNSTSGNGSYSNELEAALHAKALSDDHLINPFLTLGLGAGTYGGKIAPYVPLGVGLQANIASETYFFLQAHYRLSMDKSRLDNNLFYSFGVAGNIGKPRAPKLPPPPPPIPVVVVKDRDNDGVVDSLDACPDVAGLAKFNGCPDTDGDGIPDKDDKCPTVAGLAKYGGCPIPDTDGDGINDEQDKCPTVAGVARYNGCPIPDTDGDGINDEEDKCPSIPGVKENSGCPVIKEDVVKKVAASAKDIFFASGSSKLLPKSFKSLNNVVTILKSDANLKLDIEGHTDNAGKPDKNQLLSDKRSQAVLDYLTTKGGIEAARLSAKGFGATQPIADNKTAKGKALNRRVVLKLKYF